MAVQTVVKTVGTTGVFSTPQLWEDGAPASYTTAEQSAAGTFQVTAFAQGETITFVGSGATGKLLHTDSTGAGTGSYIIYGLTSGNPASGDVATGGTSGATCVLSSSTAAHVGVIWEAQQQNQEFSGTGVQLVIGGGTTSSTCYPHYTTVAGASFRDHASIQSNALKYDATLGAAIQGTSASTETISLTDHARVSNLQISATGSGGRGVKMGVNTENHYLDWCIVEGTYVGTNAALGVVQNVTASSDIISNCCIIQRATAADHIIATGTGSPSFYNCTIVAADDLATSPTSIFLSGASGTVTVQNCGMFAGGDKPTTAGSATFNFTTSFGDDSTPASGITTVSFSGEFQNVNDATRDFRLKTGANQIDTGTTDTTNAATDIARTARPQAGGYDSGCWEFVAAAGASIPAMMRQYRDRRA